MKLALYDLEPRTENAWIAPNATLIGEVIIKRWASVWYNSVIRGDINRVEVNNFSSIGDNSVVHTAASLPTGMNAKVYIGNNVTVGSGCTLYSCHIEDDAFIGDRCVILEGARVEKSAMLAPGSVVPPGRLIPAKCYGLETQLSTSKISLLARSGPTTPTLMWQCPLQTHTGTSSPSGPPIT
jgi:carbonic anhydrase/acetyltransferase-like protein (isoleucine patch superfamily)